MNELAIDIRGLHHTYPDGTPALRGVDLQVPRGAKAALVGRNGAGKSTLLLHLNGILRGQGTLRVLGQVLAPATLKSLRHKVGLVFQNPDDQLFALRVLDDVAFGPLNQDLPPQEAESRARQALGQVEMADAADRSPHHLSYGERRRVCIAGVLAMRPEILALDEPTANLDPQSRRGLISLLQSLPVTQLIASHDLEMVLEVCDTAFLMDQGKVLTAGPPRQLFANADLLLAHGLEPPLSLRLATPPRVS